MRFALSYREVSIVRDAHWAVFLASKDGLGRRGLVDDWERERKDKARERYEYFKNVCDELKQSIVVDSSGDSPLLTQAPQLRWTLGELEGEAEALHVYVAASTKSVDRTKRRKELQEDELREILREEEDIAIARRLIEEFEAQANRARKTIVVDVEVA